MNAKKAWTDKSGFVDAGPATGKTGNGHPNAKKAGTSSAKKGTLKMGKDAAEVKSGPGYKKK